MMTRAQKRARLYERSMIALVASLPLFTFGTIKLPTIAFVGLTALSVYALNLAPRRSYRHLRVSAAVVGYVGWCLLSATWLADSTLFVNRAMRYLIPSFIFVFVGAAVPAKLVVRGFMLGFYLTLGYTVLYLAGVSSSRAQVATESEGSLEGWHGPFLHKNALSSLVVIGAIFVLAFEHRARVKWAVLAMIGVLVLGSRSGTGFGGMVFMLTAWNWLTTFVRQRKRVTTSFVVFSLVGMIASVAVAVSSLPVVLAAAGKDVTFTGRTNIWSGVLWGISKRPFVGYGYTGVWTNPDVEPTFSILRRIGFRAFHAHSGVLDVLLQVGIVGLALFACIVLPLLSSGFKLARRGDAVGAVIVVSGAALLVMSLSESFFLGPWIPFLCLCRGMTLRANQPQAQRPLAAIDSDVDDLRVSPTLALPT